MNNVVNNSGILSRMQSAANTAGVIAVGATAGAVAGSIALPVPYIGGVVGAVAGGYIAHKGLQISSGVGSVYNGTKSYFYRAAMFLARVVKNIIILPFRIVDILLLKIPSKLIDFIINSIKAGADDIHKANANLNLLRFPIRMGVAADGFVVRALMSQSREKISEREVIGLISIGERLTQALNNPGRRMKSSGNEGIIVTVDGRDVVIKSSVETTRALAWYAAAKAIRQDAEIHGEGTDDAMLGQIAKDVIDTGEFVMIDPENKIHTFISQCPSKYEAPSGVFDKYIGNVPGAMYSSIDDGRRVLPGESGAVVVGKVKQSGGRDAVVLKLQMNQNKKLFGQSKEGHESLAWRVVETVSGFTSMANELIGDVSPVVERTPSDKHGRTKFKAAIIKAFNSIPSAVRLSKNAEDAIDAMKEMPLVQALKLFDQSLFGSNMPTSRELGGNVRTGAVEFLVKLDDLEYQELRDALVSAIKEDSSGGWDVESSKRGNEIVLYEVMRDEEIGPRVMADRRDMEAGLEELRLASRRRKEVLSDSALSAKSPEMQDRKISEVVSSGAGEVAIAFGKDVVGGAMAVGSGLVYGAVSLGSSAVSAAISVPRKALSGMMSRFF